jgi:methyl-accepting chemotaxis protein
MQITDEDGAIIRKSAEYLRPLADHIIDVFYDHSQKFPEWQAKVREVNSQLSILKGAQKDYFLRILDGRFDEEFFEHRLKVGSVHAVINVEPRWNVGNYATYSAIVFPLLAKKFKGKELTDMVVAFTKVFILDVTLATETYISEGVLQRLVDVNATLEESAENMDRGIRQVGSSAREITNAIQEVARGATEQTSAMGALSADMKQLSEAIVSVASGAEEQFARMSDAEKASAEMQAALISVSQGAKAGAEKAGASLDAAKDGMTSVQQTVEAMGVIREAVLATSTEIEELGKRGSEIGAIVQVIDDIAGQTNLLALNAAIEAARAGEQGRGFAVVADNVRSLAERTAVATKEIGALITAVQRGTGQAVKSMESSVQDVESGTARAEEAGRALSRIVEGANEVNREIEQIATASTQMETSAQNLTSVITEVGRISERLTTLATEMRSNSDRAVTSITSVTAVSEESAAASEEVSASIESVSSQVSEVETLASGLSQVANDMSTFLARFGNLAHNSAGETFVLKKTSARAA